MDPVMIGGIVRALLAALGGVLVTKGVVDNGTVESIAGAAAVIVTGVWSVLSKRRPSA